MGLPGKEAGSSGHRTWEVQVQLNPGTGVRPSGSSLPLLHSLSSTPPPPAIWGLAGEKSSEAPGSHNLAISIEKKCLFPEVHKEEETDLSNISNMLGSYLILFRTNSFKKPIA